MTGRSARPSSWSSRERDESCRSRQNVRHKTSLWAERAAPGLPALCCWRQVSVGACGRANAVAALQRRLSRPTGFGVPLQASSPAVALKYPPRLALPPPQDPVSEALPSSPPLTQRGRPRPPERRTIRRSGPSAPGSPRRTHRTAPPCSHSTVRAHTAGGTQPVPAILTGTTRWVPWPVGPGVARRRRDAPGWSGPRAFDFERDRGAEPDHRRADCRPTHP